MITISTPPVVSAPCNKKKKYLHNFNAAVVANAMYPKIPMYTMGMPPKLFCTGESVCPEQGHPMLESSARTIPKVQRRITVKSLSF